MKPKVNQFLATLSLLLFLAALTGCVREFEYDCPTPGAADEVQVSFHVETSAASTVPTRALIQTTPETLIENFVVIAFDKDDKFAYYKEVQVTDPSKATDNFTVGVIRSANDEDKYSFVVMTNIAASTLGLPDIEKGDQTKTELLGSLNYQHAALMSTGTYLPMSSPSTQKVKVVEGLKFNQAEKGNQYEVIRLVRITARVDMKIGSAITGKYRLKTVMLYDFNDRGSMWNPALNTSTTLNAPLVPGDAVIADAPVSVTLDEGGTEFTSKLYMFESAIADKTCLVVGLERSIDNGATWVDADTDGKPDVDYFKVLFAKKNASDVITPFDVVRNHRYEFTITGVNGNGFKEPEDAYKSVIAGMDVDIIDWDEANMNVVVTDGIHILSVTPGEITLPKDEVKYTDGFNLLIATDFEVQGGKNWWAEYYANEEGTIKLTGEDLWLELEKPSGNVIYNPKDESTKTLTRLKAKPNNGGDRTAWIHIKTRVLNFKVKVTQLDFSPTYVWVTDLEGNLISSLSFSNEKPEQKQFKVTWSPKTQPLRIERIPGAEAFEYTDNDRTSNWTEIPAYKNGSYTFTINPVPFTGEDLKENPFKASSTTLQFVIGDGKGNISEAGINLRQMTYRIIPEGFKDGYINFSVTASIKSNARWTMSIVDESDILSTRVKPPTSGAASITGSKFDYRFTDVSGKGEATFRFSSPDGLFVDTLITVKLLPVSALFAKSNIVYKKVDDDKYILTFAETMERNNEIPANAQGVFFRWGSLVAINTPQQDDAGTAFNPDDDIVFRPPNNDTPIVSWDNIPYCTTYELGTGWSTFDDVFMMGKFPAEQAGRGYHSQNGIGDICRYISDQEGWVNGRWRMPTVNELERIFERQETPMQPEPNEYGYYQTGIPYGSFEIQKNTSRDGLTPISSGVLGGSGIDYTVDGGDGQERAPNHEEKVFFPASGIFDFHSDPRAISNVGIYGNYYMSSVPIDLFAVEKNGFTGWSSNGYLRNATPIRCIRDGILNP